VRLMVTRRKHTGATDARGISMDLPVRDVLIDTAH